MQRSGHGTAWHKANLFFTKEGSCELWNLSCIRSVKMQCIVLDHLSVNSFPSLPSVENPFTTNDFILAPANNERGNFTQHDILYVVVVSLW